jgi:hypothetical protein
MKNSALMAESLAIVSKGESRMQSPWTAQSCEAGFTICVTLASRRTVLLLHKFSTLPEQVSII